MLKVSKSRKQIMKSRILQKKRTKHTQDSILSEFRSFFGRIKDIIICFWDLLTFSKKWLFHWHLITFFRAYLVTILKALPAVFCSYLFLIRKIGKEFYEISEPSRLVFRHQIYCCDQIFRPGKIKSFTRRQLHSITLIQN